MNKKTATFFGIGAFGKDLMYAMSTVLSFFLIDLVGMNPLWIGTMFMVVRVWDAINDPIMGTIVQNTKSKYGKFRPWILIGSLINAVILIFMYWNPGLDPQTVGAFVWVTVFYTLWGMSYTLMDIPFWSMLPTFSKDQRLRENYTSIARISAQFGFAVVAAGSLIFAQILGGGESDAQMVNGYLKFAIVVSIIFAITQVLVFLFVKEEHTSSAEDSMTLKEMFVHLKDNDQLMAVALVVVIYNSVLYITSTMAIYFLRYDIGDVTLFGTEFNYQSFNMVFLAIGFLLQILAMAVYPVFSKRMKRAKVFELGIWLSILGFALLLVNAFILSNNIYLLMIATAFVFFGLGILLIAQTVLLTDTVDYGEWKNGKRSESAVFGIQTFIVKMATGISMGIVGAGLAIIGFNGDLDVQSASTVTGIRLLMFILPIIGMVLALFIFRSKHNLDEEKYAKVIKELEERKTV